MKIVIEISDTLKKIADDEDTKTFSHMVWQAIVMDAIKNGQPLPKGHGRLIDEQDAIDTLSVMFSGNDEILNDALECIEQLPEVIEADGGNENGNG